MKIKLFAISLGLFLFASVNVSAQGLYQKSNESNEDIESSGSESSGSGRGLRLDRPKPAEPGEPIGEGILVLTALAGGYAIIKKRNTKKGGYEA
ncbi:MAG: hypothetical protein LBQ84_01000 [Flavobacteriaceae bacterium]|jgi:hypothetical protein|nr:hypothetical protein [Flavobacteriaceae bacterium]